MPGHQADRQRHDRGRAGLRRLPRLRRRGHGRRARGVPALPAPVLRADAGHLAVLQHVPVRLGGAGEAVRRARGGALGPRADRPRSRSATARGDAALRRRRGSRTSRTGRCCPTSTSTSRPGRRVALVGTTGAGKTTLAKLVTRFYDPTDGRGARSTASTSATSPPTTCADAVVMVTQENFLFTGTVADNIRFGRPDATDRGDRRGGHGDRRARLHHRAARRLRHRRRQPRRTALGRPAPAGRVRPRLPRRPGGADPRRGDVLARRAVRAAGAAGAAHDPRRAHRDHHRPPAVDGRDRRPGARAWSTAGSSRTARPADLIAGGDGRFSDLHDAWLASLA